MLERNRVYNGDCMHYMKLLDDKSVNLYYTDTPYNMGSRYTIDTEGHYVFKGKGSDFMSKWEAMDGRWWDKYFQEVNRTLKIGGFYITHNIDRQSDMWTYYARRNNLVPMQKLYWLFIDNFPKSADVELAVEKKVGEPSAMSSKYTGYKYGQMSLKQVLEEVLVFCKEPEDSVINTIMEYEKQLSSNGIVNIHPPILNIKRTMVVPEKKISLPGDERYTPQLLVERKTAPFIKSGGTSVLDMAGIGDILPKIDFHATDLIPYMYEPKISKSEKEFGLEGHAIGEKVISGKGLLNKNGTDKSSSKTRNIHPTPKPINLCKWILTLFKIPDQMLVVDTFAGQGSIPMACKDMGIDFIGTEINEDFYKLCQSKLKNMQESLF